MKSRMLLIALAVLIVGCNKKGDKGEAGASAASSIINKNGAVTSDSIAVTIPGLSISRGDILAVYTCIGTACVQINEYQTGTGNNIIYIAQGTTVTILGAMTGSQTLWYISALEKV